MLAALAIPFKMPAKRGEKPNPTQGRLCNMLHPNKCFARAIAADLSGDRRMGQLRLQEDQPIRLILSLG